ncbi:purine-nucleoside phosphorylase [Consotaella salsifontis]|uniref:Purine nucleoside phosphorylase n=1 Tax=Consotaella salsifontis TaxID=1365950 RepID=A0A1T4S1T0_9HYPH|nr:purine-nucleoside phosphorylase [Consotaella salsifontis]SKA22127.1 purine-nucleoside phosphorylase [Consotaella salsifontis]
MNKIAATLAERIEGRHPKIALILGSGLGSLVESLSHAIRVPYGEIEGMPVSGVSGHAGEFVSGSLGGVPVLVLSGRVHYYEAGDPSVMRPAIEALRDLGVETLCLTNSAGSVNPTMAPGSVMLISDHIAFSGKNPLIGEPSDSRFVGMTAAYDRGLRIAMREAAREVGVEVAEGVYMWFSGPSFETPAEIRMARTLGADAVGMSTVPETILARFYGMKVVGASVITNFGAGMTGAELSHEETKTMAPLGGQKLARVLGAAVSRF